MLFQLNSRFFLLEVLGSHYYKKKCRCVIVVMTIYFRCDYSHGTRRLRSTPP